MLGWDNRQFQHQVLDRTWIAHELVPHSKRWPTQPSGYSFQTIVKHFSEHLCRILQNWLKCSDSFVSEHWSMLILHALATCMEEWCQFYRVRANCLWHSKTKMNEIHWVMPNDVCIDFKSAASKEMLWNNTSWIVIHLYNINYISPNTSPYPYPFMNFGRSKTHMGSYIQEFFQFQRCMKIISLNARENILCRISKVFPLKFYHNILAIHWKMRVALRRKNLRSLSFTELMSCFKRVSYIRRSGSSATIVIQVTDRETSDSDVWLTQSITEPLFTKR